MFTFKQVNNNKTHTIMKRITGIEQVNLETFLTDWSKAFGVNSYELCLEAFENAIDALGSLFSKDLESLKKWGEPLDVFNFFYKYELVHSELASVCAIASFIQKHTGEEASLYDLECIRKDYIYMKSHGYISFVVHKLQSYVDIFSLEWEELDKLKQTIEYPIAGE